MLRFRPKLGSERSSEWRCCFCLHVRTGTILLGTWHLMLHLIALGFLAAVVRDPRLLDELERDSATVADWSDAGHRYEMPTPLSNVEPRPSNLQHTTPPRDHNLIYRVTLDSKLHFNLHIDSMVAKAFKQLGLILRLGKPFARGSTLKILYNAYVRSILEFGSVVWSPQYAVHKDRIERVQRKFIKSLDYRVGFYYNDYEESAKRHEVQSLVCRRHVTATGYLCYLRSIHRLVAETRRVPWRAQLLQLPAPALALVVVSAFLAAVLLKAYCINIVWRCYKYLTMRTHALQSLTPFVISSEGVVSAGTAPPPYAAPPAPAPDYSSLLPDYEEAVKQTPPPSYRAATLMTPGDPPAAAPSGTTETTNAATTVVMLPAAGDHARV
ncbi:hypothetical protein evm_010000 [Chilo suppressalis]|nr:hypothetical protein evm_010000 [Chilo suppressalis]